MMSESNVAPTQVTVTTGAPQPTVKTDPGQNPGSMAWLHINIEYFKTIPGLLKIVQVVVGIICMACASPALLGGTHWFLFVAVTSFIATLIWIFLYLLSIREALKLPINWTLTELLNLAITTVLYVTAFIVQLSVWGGVVSSWRGSNIAAGVFGIINAIAYGASTYFLYLEWKAGVNPQ